jgi:hypothetical protein
MSTTSALPPLDPLLRRSAKRTRDIFASCPNDGITEDEKRCVTSSGTPSTFTEEIFSARIRLSVKINDEYRDFKELPPALLAQQGPIGPARPKEQRKAITAGRRLTGLLSLTGSLISSYSIQRHIKDDCHNRQHTQSATVHVRHVQ